MYVCMYVYVCMSTGGPANSNNNNSSSNAIAAPSSSSSVDDIGIRAAGGEDDAQSALGRLTAQVCR